MSVKEKLATIRDQLLKLHSLLLADQRAEYEQMFGAIKTNGEMLNLVLNDEWFAWLRALSTLIVEMDEVQANKKGFDEAAAKTLVEYTEALMVPAEEGAVFRQKYHAAVQRNPDVLIAHVQLKRLFPGPAAEA